MIFIYHNLIKNVVENLSISDLEKIANHYHISYTKDELFIVYNFIKEEYIALLNQKTEVFNKIKNRIRPALYEFLLHTYMNYQQKYLS